MLTRFKTVGVVGAGAMGRGIAQMATQAGCAVRLYDTQAAARDAAHPHGARLRLAVQRHRAARQANSRGVSRR